MIRRTRYHRGPSPALCGLTLLLVVPVLFGQEPPGEEPVPLSERLRQGDTEAIALLQRQFEQAATKAEKQRTASLLVALGFDDGYYDYIAEIAREAVESDAPFPLALDERGEPIPKELSDEFLTWARDAGVDPAQAAHEFIYELPGDLLHLGMTFDPRAAEILLQGLDSPNPMIAYRAAEGLARIGAVEAVPAIIAAVDAVPVPFQQPLARALVYFDDPAAQAAAERLIGDPRLVEVLRRQAQVERQQIQKDLASFKR